MDQDANSPAPAPLPPICITIQYVLRYDRQLTYSVIPHILTYIIH